MLLLDKNQRNHFGKGHPVRAELQIALCEGGVVKLHAAVEIVDGQLVHKPSGDKADQLFPEGTIKAAAAAGIRTAVSDHQVRVGLLLFFQQVQNIFQPVLSVRVHRDGKAGPGKLQTADERSAVSAVHFVMTDLQKRMGSGGFIQQCAGPVCGTIIHNDEL